MPFSVVSFVKNGTDKVLLRGNEFVFVPCLYCSQSFTSYRAVNTLFLGYKSQSVNIVYCSEIHIKHINTLCGQNVELLNVKLVVHIVTTVRYIQ
jgi:hypothetical protein